MKKQILLVGFSFLIAVSMASCKKEKGITTSTFFGQWKASYGDTVLFFWLNGKNMARYDMSMNPAMPATGDFEYTYRDNKLGIKDGLSGLWGFRIFQSFKWLEEGRSFEIQGVEWFPFISSTSTYFTFTKIP